MKFKGKLFDTEHPGYDVSEAILTKTRVAIDYADDEGTVFHISARSRDGETYVGKWGEGDLNEDCEISLRSILGQERPSRSVRSVGGPRVRL